MNTFRYPPPPSLSHSAPTQAKGNCKEAPLAEFKFCYLESLPPPIASRSGRFILLHGPHLKVIEPRRGCARAAEGGQKRDDGSRSFAAPRPCACRPVLVSLPTRQLCSRPPAPTERGEAPGRESGKERYVWCKEAEGNCVSAPRAAPRARGDRIALPAGCSHPSCGLSAAREDC